MYRFKLHLDCYPSWIVSLKYFSSLSCQKGQVQQHLSILLVTLFSSLPIKYSYISLIRVKEFKLYNPQLLQVI